MGMYGSRAVTLLVLISDDVINRILKLDMQTNILVYVTRCCTDLTSKVLKERTFGQSSALLKSHRVPIPSIMNEKKFSNRCLFLKAKGKTKSNHEVLGLWQRSLRLHDVIDF